MLDMRRTTELLNMMQLSNSMKRNESPNSMRWNNTAIDKLDTETDRTVTVSTGEA